MFHRGRDLSLRRTLLLVSDIIVLAVSFGFLAPAARFGPVPGLVYAQQNQFALAACVAIYLVVFYAAGMYERSSLTRKANSYQLPLVTVLIGAAISSAIFYANTDLQLGRGVFMIASGYVFLLAWITRYLYRMAVGYGLLSKKALLVGEGRDAERALKLIRDTHDSGLKVLGLVSEKRSAAGLFFQDLPIVGGTEKLRELVDAFEVETLIVATSLSREPVVLRQLRPMRCSGIEIIDYVSLYESLAQEVPLDHINDEWLMNAALNSSVIHIRKIKRILDFVVALIGLILAAPICMIVVPLIRIDSPGPVFYRQRRSGRDGHTYTLLKFRTMRQDAEAATGAVWSTSNDNRITRIGKFLRKWRVDEIPQLINVMRGDMSLVGPRPERPEFVETLSGAIPFYMERLMVPPGVTGWAQIKFPYASNIEGARRKLQFDLYYIKHMGFMLDLSILLRTVKTVLVGLRHNDHEQAPDVESPPITLLDQGADEVKAAQSA